MINKAGQVTEIKDSAGVSTLYEYDILGRRSRIYNDDGLEARYGYDALNRVSHMEAGLGHALIAYVPITRKMLRNGRISRKWGMRYGHGLNAHIAG